MNGAVRSDPRWEAAPAFHQRDKFFSVEVYPVTVFL